MIRFTWLLFGTIWMSYATHLIDAFQPVATKVDRHDDFVKLASRRSNENEKYSDDMSELPHKFTRRSFMGESVISGVMSGFLVSLLKDNVSVADTGAEVRGTAVNAFNGLAFQYRGSDFNGLTASEINEPSISYQEFVSKLKSGDVLSVEFYAPDGDVAYATLKSTSNQPNNNKIRIGEGYPIEQHDGYSSPAFAIRTVKNANVPYKFIVPALANSKQ